MKVPLAGGTPAVLASACGVDSPYEKYAAHVAVDGTSVYWTCGDGVTFAVMKVASAGGTPVTLAWRAPQESLGIEAKSIAVDTTSVYWTEGDGNGRVVKLTPK
jgi:hypothetical protein